MEFIKKEFLYTKLCINLSQPKKQKSSSVLKQISLCKHGENAINSWLFKSKWALMLLRCQNIIWSFFKTPNFWSLENFVFTFLGDADFCDTWCTFKLQTNLIDACILHHSLTLCIKVRLIGSFFTMFALTLLKDLDWIVVYIIKSRHCKKDGSIIPNLFKILESWNKLIKVLVIFL